MRKLIAAALAVVLIGGTIVPVAQANDWRPGRDWHGRDWHDRDHRSRHGDDTVGKIALGLAAFAVFSQVVGLLHDQPAYAPAPAVTYGPPPASYGDYADESQVIDYPNGQYVLRGNQWVWVPKAPAPPPPPPFR